VRLHDVSKGDRFIDSNTKILSNADLSQLQKVLLMMLDDLLLICTKNNILFIAIGGTAIGAMRHRGFIPWDDDLDIAMTRKDYQKLVDIYRIKFKDKYNISDANDECNYGLIIPKIRLAGTTYRTVLEENIKDCGIRIDIFIIENVFNNFVLRYIQGIGSLFFGFVLSSKRMFECRKEFARFTENFSFKIKMIFGSIFCFVSIEKWARITNKWYSICCDDKSIFVSVPTDGAHFFGELTRRSALCEVCLADFEGRKLFVPSSVDKYLTRIYGDYMQLPSSNKQVRSFYLDFNLGKYGTKVIYK
jgi:lipopolysaccharide cholinephosphotransferase